MPELPEVETVRRGLEKLIVGRCIKATTHDNEKSFQIVPNDFKSFLKNSEIIAVHRRAKVLIIDLSTEHSLVIHLKMTGQLIYVGAANGPGRWGGGHPNDSFIHDLPDKSTRLVITFTDGSHLYFNDQRKFGWVRLYPTVEVPNIDFMKKVGPEPLEDTFTGDVFYARLQRRKNTTIKAAILDQTVLAGVGNIYADESLWGAKIHPRTLVKDVPAVKIHQLATEIKAVMNLSIEKGGSTDRNYVDAEGKKGSYLSFARVFRREGQFCPRCDTTIEKIRVAGRGTHLCPTCQTMK